MLNVYRNVILSTSGQKVYIAYIHTYIVYYIIIGNEFETYIYGTLCYERLPKYFVSFI